MFFLPQFRFNYLNVFLLNTLKNINIDVSSRVSSNINIIKNINITVRENTFIGSNCCFNGAVGSAISIGKNCDISDYVHFVTGTHEINPKESRLRRAGKGCFKNIEIGDNVWIGYRVTILPGVRIGDGAIIGAGCVVYKNVLEGELIVSNSAIKK